MIDIIIPVYNTPVKDLKRCFESIKNQTYKDYTVYIIDDGSNNNTKEFIDKYIKDKKNFIVKHIQNSGVSSARNLGIELSNSKYLTFVDSDDTLEKDFLIEAYNLIEENDLDIIIGGYNEVVDNKISKIRQCNTGIHIYTKENINLFFDKLLSGKIRDDNKEIASAPVGRIYTRLYKRESIGNIRFKQNVHMSEDTLFMIDLMYRINKIGLVSNIWYNYYQNSYSIVHNSNYKKLVDSNLTFIKEIEKRLRLEEDIQLRNAYRMRLFKTILNICDILNKSNNKELIAKIKNDDSLIKEFKNINIQKYINITNEEKELLNNYL